MSETEAMDRTALDEALEAASRAFKATAQSQIDQIKQQMTNVLRVQYADAPKAAIRPDLPAPRLQLRWAKDHRHNYEKTCYYELILPLREHDCRNDDKQGYGVIELSRTSVGCPDRWSGDDPWFNTPFRDGSHILWDCDAFGGSLPMYVICWDGTAQALIRKADRAASTTKEG